MTNYQEVENAFRSWWTNYNADSDDLPGDSHLARAAFEAGVRKAGGSIKPALTSVTHAPVHGSERDPYEVANQLGGFVGPDTDKKLSAFLIREGKEAALLADEIGRLRNEV
jgi:hypothetical protein